jgi:phenylacetate 2-hydroxylase
MCTAVNFSNRVLYALFLRLIVSFKFTPSKESPAITHYIDYKRDPSESNSIPKEFKVKLTPRDEDALERCVLQTEERLADFNVGENAEPLLKH